MEELKLKLSASEINSKEFQAKNGGYDALQVDRYLDLIVNDYIAFEQYENSTKKLYANYDEFVKFIKLNFLNQNIKEHFYKKKLKF